MQLSNWWPANSGLTFVHPWLLLLLLAIPLLAYLRGQRGPAAALTFSSTATLRAIGKHSAARAGKILRTLLLATLAIFVIALARPQLGKTLTQVEASGIDIMLVLDVSNSMLTKDFTIGGEEATRLDAVREDTRKFIEARPNDRIGIIAFGTQPYVVSPMTLDHDWLLQNLDRVKIGLIEGSTAIGSAMASAANRLNDKHAKSRAIVLLTDGDNNAGRIPPNTAAEAVKALHIKLYAIGIGTNGIAPVPMGNPQTGQILTDAVGNILYQNARGNLSRYRQDGEIDRKREKISAIPRSLSHLHYECVRTVDWANFTVTNHLEEIAVKTTSILFQCGRGLGAPIEHQSTGSRSRGAQAAPTL